MSDQTVFVQKGTPSSPLIVLNSFGDEWKHVVDSLDQMGISSYSMLAVMCSEWNKELAPWDAKAVFKGEPDFEGGAVLYLERLTKEIIPETVKTYGLDPSSFYIAGYSMAGLFALYSLYETDVFAGAASCSGSLWFPGFKDYVFENSFKGTPKKIYMSLGDREARTKNKIMATVEDNTRAVAEHYKDLVADVCFEMNQGGHFTDPAQRTARGIDFLLGQNC